MPLELRSTSCEYVITDESGYKFKIIAKQHLEGGWVGAWYADVTFSVDGASNPDAALRRLLPAAEHFVRMLKEHFNEQS